MHLPPDWMLGAVQRFGGAPAAFGLALLLFGWRRLVRFRLPAHLNRPALLTHIGLLVLMLALRPVYARVAAAHSLADPPLFWLATLWTALIPLLVLTLLLVFVPWHTLLSLARSLGLAWLYALGVTLAISLLRMMGTLAWTTSSDGFVGWVQQACFEQTRALLRHFYTTVVSNPEKHLLGTERFQIQVSWLCSGVEGLVLVALLIPLWVVFFRRELNVRRAQLVAPVALLLTWFANIVRLAILIAIGDHGHPLLADIGFHAQAGWVSLNLITLGCLLLVQRHPWFRQDGVPEAGRRVSEAVNYPVVYLLPFTLILGTSLITQALSAGFEAFYVVRLVVALAALWILRSHYLQMDWRFSSLSILAGVAVGVIWLAIRLKFKVVTPGVLITTNALTVMSRPLRLAWIATRVAAATITVPIAEELAFRGFAARRVMRVDFEHQPYRGMNWVSLLVSSVAFGAMHGRMWPAGAVTGALFWWLAKSKNRIGDAVAAHAVANALIAVVAVHLHDYSLW
ncbi:exosortase E/protease, VPEID-CTERM system [Terriglobus aquaticus]|uniref:Exosortase E/protease, VPEID-CTERM system n=1 Tax=Terriglobus aquaticus TaxID=940139 RepID=A0ABW9KIT3_9BACT|nr:exosortase E/protease, VPEID-CTERM system [Terriglobus aquaticus]